MPLMETNHKCLILITVLESPDSVFYKDCCRRLIRSAATVGADVDCLILHNLKQNIFVREVHRVAEVQLSLPDISAELVEAYAQRIRPELYGRVNVDEYDKVCIMDADAIFSKSFNFASDELGAISCAETYFVSNWEHDSMDSFQHPKYTPAFSIFEAIYFIELMTEWAFETDVQCDLGAYRPDIIAFDLAVRKISHAHQVEPRSLAATHFAQDCSPISALYNASIIHVGSQPIISGAQMIHSRTPRDRMRFLNVLMMNIVFPKACNELITNAID